MLETRQTSQTKQLEEMIAQASSTKAKIDLMNTLAWQLRIQDSERAQTLSLEAMQLAKARELNYEPGIANSLVTLAFLDGEAGKLDTSLSHSLEALAYLKEQPLSEILIGAWYTLGWAYYYSSDYPAALEFGLKALKLAHELKHQEKEAWCLDLVASTYKDPVQALQMYKDAHAIFEKADHLEGQSRILNNWAYTLLEAKDYPAALELAQKSLQLAKLAGLKRDEINVTATIGEILAGMGDYATAQSQLHAATLLFDEYGRDISSVYILVDLGQVYLEQNDLERAERELFNALGLSEQMEMRNEQARCHKYLSEVFERQGQFDKALAHHKIFQSLREGIAGEGALQQLAALRVSHQIETAQRDSEIHRLQKEKLQIELDEHKRLHAVLEDLATRDPLTNLFNRRHFLNLAEHEWHRALRYQHPLCALMLDVDHFKKINDQHGHAAGDKALTTFANIIRSSLRTTEIAGRYGGDEFVILLPETLPQHGLLVARRICQEIIQYPISSDNGAIELTPSIGVACATKDNIVKLQSLSELLSNADKAMYTAKRAGKAQVHLYAD